MEIVKDEVLKNFAETGEVKSEQKVATPAPTYDPHKRYQWQPSDQFVMSGEEFSLILNNIRTFLARPESQLVLKAQHAHYAIEEILARGVSLGFVKEMQEPKKEKLGTEK